MGNDDGASSRTLQVFIAVQIRIPRNRCKKDRVIFIHILGFGVITSQILHVNCVLTEMTSRMVTFFPIHVNSISYILYLIYL